MQNPSKQGLKPNRLLSIWFVGSRRNAKSIKTRIETQLMEPIGILPHRRNAKSIKTRIETHLMIGCSS